MSEEEEDTTLGEGIVVIPGVNDLPIFASLEARKIHKENLKLEKQVEGVDNEISDMHERVKVMKEHFKNVQQEVEHTNSLQGAKKAEIDTERHMRQLTSRALGRGQNESKQLHSQIDFIKEQVNLVQSQIFKATERMDEFKTQMNWNQEELEQWALAAKQKEEDFLAIEKYKRADEQKIKELMLQLEQLNRELLAEKSKLDTEATETQAKQMELDRIAQEFKVAHNERQTLITRWQETIAEMKKRDKEINDLGERFAVAKADRTRKETQYNLQRTRLASQQTENKEVEQRAETLSRVVLRKREEMMAGSVKLNEFRGELESLKNELTTGAESIIRKRNNNTNLSKVVEENRVQLERERQKYQVTKSKIEEAKSSNVKAEQMAKAAESELIQREREFNQQLLRVKSLQEKVIKENQALHNLRTEDGRLRSEISGARSMSKNLEGQLNQLDKEAARQQELLYNAEFQIQQIERKIARGMGERSDDEKIQLRKQIDHLEKELDEVKERRKVLQQQNRRLQNELAALRTKKDDLGNRYTVLTEALGEKELENRMIEEEIRRENRDFEEITVSNDLLLLEVKRLRDLLSAKSDAVFSLENRKQQLLLSLEERKQEIAVQRDLLRAESKQLNDDRHRITLELRQRQTNVDRLKARYEVSNSSGGPDGNGEQHSQAYYVIMAAQKREELQRRGDQLDQDIRKCEKEIRALQITLEHLNIRNAAFRESFQKIDIKGEDAEVLVQLEERIKLNKDALFRKKKDVQRLTTDLEEDTRRLEQVTQQSEKIMKQKDHLESAKQQVEDELLTQQGQLQELADRMRKVQARHHQRFVDRGGDLSKFPNGTLEEKSVRADVLRDVVQNVLYTLGQLSQEFPEVGDVLTSRLNEADLRLPTKPPSKSVTRASMTTGRNGSTRASALLPQPPQYGQHGPPSVNSGSGAFVQPRTFAVGL